MSGKIARTIVIDIADNWGSSTAMGIRRVEFYRLGSRDNFSVASATTLESSHYTATPPIFTARQAFDVTLTKTGSWQYGWVSAASNTTNQRIICAPYPAGTIEFDTIVINNFHSSGGSLNYGAKNIKIYITEDTYTDTTYNAAVTNSELLFDGQLAQHIASDTADDQEVWSMLVHTDVPVAGSISVSSSVGVGFDTPTSGQLQISDSIVDTAVGANITVNSGVSFLVGKTLASFGIGAESNMSIPMSGAFTAGFSASELFHKLIIGSMDVAVTHAFSLESAIVPHVNFSLAVASPSMVLGHNFSYLNFSITVPNPLDAAPGHTAVLYECYLDDLYIPISSFQTRSRNQTPSFLQVVTPGLELAEDIADNLEGDIRVDIVYLNTKTDERATKTILTVPLDNVDPTGTRSITLSGSDRIYYSSYLSDPDDPAGELEEAAGHPDLNAPNTVEIFDFEITSVSTRKGLMELTLAREHINLNAGDFVKYSGTTYRIDSIECAIGKGVRRVVIKEGPQPVSYLS